MALTSSTAHASGIYNPGSGGGSGGSSSLEVLVNGLRVSSPTASINFAGSGVSGGVSGSTATVTITGDGRGYNVEPASVTFQLLKGVTLSTMTANNVLMTWPSSGTVGNYLRYISTNTLSWDGVAAGGISGVTLPLPGGGTNYWNIASTGTFPAPFGITASTAILSGKLTALNIQISSNSILANTTFYQDGTVIVGNTAIAPAAGDFLLQVSSANGTALFGIQQNGHVISSGTIPSVSVCGTSPSMDGNATDFAGTINVGSVLATACTLTFANPFGTVPTCVVGDDSTAITPAITARSTTAITIGLSASLASGHIFYICVGKQ